MGISVDMVTRGDASNGVAVVIGVDIWGFILATHCTPSLTGYLFFIVD